MTEAAPINEFRRYPNRSRGKVRSLSADALGVVDPTLQSNNSSTPSTSPDWRIPLDDDGGTLSLLEDVLTLLRDGYAGVIFVGPPGTSKSWYAARVARHLADDDVSRVRSVQFHPSYQYEDFIEGLVPTEQGGFVWEDRHLLALSDSARRSPDLLFVLVIDELSRADPGRVFGEALTYIEMTKRNQPFYLASGRETSIPPNLVILATMNPLDRGVDEVDSALERRFAKISMDLDPAILDEILRENGVQDDLRARIARFFSYIQKLDNPYAKVGHAYFRSVNGPESLERLWKYQLSYLFEKAFSRDPQSLAEVRRQWDRVLADTTASREQNATGVPSGEAEIEETSQLGSNAVENEA